MKRLELFEFEDFSWFPRTWRTSMTNLIVVLHKMFGTKEVLVNLLSGVRQRHNFSQIVDIGSGSGGPMPDAVSELNEKDKNAPLNLLLTDLHPNPEFVKQVNNRGEDYLKYQEAPFDATNFKNAPEGLKTMVNSFHHLSPDKAKTVLESAQENKQPILIYEMAKNNIPTLVWWLTLPLGLTILIIMSLVMTFFVRPLKWQQLLFTFLIPVIPIFYAWDGQASNMRMYAFKDVERLLEDFRNESYSWEIADAKNEKGQTKGYYILGLPNK